VVVRDVEGLTLFAPSVWKDAKGKALPPPPGVSFATASGQAVFDAQGEVRDTRGAIKTATPREPTAR
jgi:hypothetical protein